MRRSEFRELLQKELAGSGISVVPMETIQTPWPHMNRIGGIMTPRRQFVPVPPEVSPTPQEEIRSEGKEDDTL